MTTVYLGLGSNLGDKAKNIRSALSYLQRSPGISGVRASEPVETIPEGGPDHQQRYLNMAVKAEFSGDPRQLLSLTSDIELRLGRTRSVTCGPRTMDIDILFFGSRIIKTSSLTIPHPRLHERVFVLEPLSSIAPSLRHPILKTTIDELLERLMPKVIRSIDDIRNYVKSASDSGMTIGLVPTMGALHEGHISLMRKAKEENDLCVASIFVNPIQFGPKEDFSRYPRTLDKDVRFCASAHVDCVFCPSVESIYPDGFDTIIDQKRLPEHLCGLSRPGHFRGVMTVCAKLFNLVRPDRSYFGRKDYQQAVIVRKMAEDLSIGTEIRIIPIVREPDGLAMSSRNSYLSGNERASAPIIYSAMSRTAALARKTRTPSARVVSMLRKDILRVFPAKIDYISVIDPATLQDRPVASRGSVIAVAARFGKTRLIDNVTI